MPSTHSNICPNMTTGSKRDKCVIAAKADALALETLEFDISINVSLDIHSKRPIPPGAAGIDDPILVIPVTNIEAIREM